MTHEFSQANLVWCEETCAFAICIGDAHDRPKAFDDAYLIIAVNFHEHIFEIIN